MARQALVKTLSPGQNPPAAGGTVVTWTAADVSNGDEISLTDKDMLLVRNVHASTGYTYTVASVADERGRTGDLTTIALAAGVMHVIGNGMGTGWLQTTGKLNLNANNTNIQWAIITNR